MGFPLNHFGMPIVVRLVQQSCWWDIMFVDSDVTGRQNLTADTLILWLL